MRRSHFNNFTLDSIAPSPSVSMLGSTSPSKTVSQSRVQPHRPAKNKPPIIDYDSSDNAPIFSDIYYDNERGSEPPGRCMSPNQDADSSSCRIDSVSDPFSDTTSDLFFDDAFRPSSFSDHHSYSSSSLDQGLTDVNTSATSSYAGCKHVPSSRKLVPIACSALNDTAIVDPVLSNPQSDYLYLRSRDGLGRHGGSTRRFYDLVEHRAPSPHSSPSFVSSLGDKQDGGGCRYSDTTAQHVHTLARQESYARSRKAAPIAHSVLNDTVIVEPVRSTLQQDRSYHRC
jgi:hypothetical protein